MVLNIHRLEELQTTLINIIKVGDEHESNLKVYNTMFTYKWREILRKEKQIINIYINSETDDDKEVENIIKNNYISQFVSVSSSKAKSHYDFAKHLLNKLKWWLLCVNKKMRKFKALPNTYETNQKLGISYQYLKIIVFRADKMFSKINLASMMMSQEYEKIKSIENKVNEIYNNIRIKTTDTKDILNSSVSSDEDLSDNEEEAVNSTEN